MGKLTELQTQKDAIQTQIDAFLSVPADTFPIGTLMIVDFATPSNKVYLRKVNEEAWIKMSGTGGTKEFAEWILEYLGLGYFEIYKLTAETAPIFVNDV